MFSKLQDRVFTSPAVLGDYLFRIRERYFCSEFKNVLRRDEYFTIHFYIEKLLIYCPKSERCVKICHVYISAMMSHFREGITILLN
jgi:hypothetical protein